jgi:1-deoxy-D-xylulose-5-phosphate reductoisomerase
MKTKNLVVLGSTGTIGINTLKIVRQYPQQFRVVGLTACNNFKLLEKQIREFKPQYVAIGKQGFDYLRRRFDRASVKILDVDKESGFIVSLKSVDIVVIGMRGGAALAPFLEAVRHGKTVAPANKEALVMAGPLLMRLARKHNAKIIPVDSEQSAIFQCLEGHRREDLKRVILTASGGALRKVPLTRFDRLSVNEILRHPRWKMGEKITVDSATLMNKGFEVIEAMRLFDLTVDQVQVVIHPEAIIHSMVEFKDGSIIAQMGITDMRLPIQYALTYPHRLGTGLASTDFYHLKQLTFGKPDFKRFPSLALALRVAREGGTFPSVLNAADEVAVDAFLNQKINFTGIYRIVERTVRRHRIVRDPDLKQILEADIWARAQATRLIEE